jgi:hypothetical protein
MLKKLFDSRPAEDDVEALPQDSTPPIEDDVVPLIGPEEEPTPIMEDDEGKESARDGTDDVAVAATPVEDLTAVRDLILTLHPAIVPELIGGETLQAIIASIEPAQRAHSRIVGNLSIPAGGNPSITIDADSISAFDKIRRGLSAGNPRR